MSLEKIRTEEDPLFASFGRGGLFERWVDPQTKVESFILRSRVAPVQQSFYFVNSGFTDDGRFLWFYCAFPPGGDAYYGRQLAVADFMEGTVRHFPETLFTDASPFVDPLTGEIYWTTGLGVWKRGPFLKDKVERVGLFPEELAKNRRPLRLATHLTRSADGRNFAMDAQIGCDWFVGDMPANGRGGFQLWQTFDLCHNHAQFSPTDPDLILLAQDGWFDPVSGQEGKTQDRLWLLRRGEKARPILPRSPARSSQRGHEWWDADGRHVWYIDYHGGTAKADITTGESTLVWPAGHTHSHCDRSGQLIAGDINPEGDDWRVAFFNARTGKGIDIVSKFPSSTQPRRSYHIHPHPRFCLGDRYLCYTTTVLGRSDVALVPVAQLIGRTT